MTFQERLNDVLNELEYTNYVEDAAIAKTLGKIADEARPPFRRRDAEHVLDRFINIARWAKKELKKR